MGNYTLGNLALRTVFFIHSFFFLLYMLTNSISDSIIWYNG